MIKPPDAFLQPGYPAHDASSGSASAGARPAGSPSSASTGTELIDRGESAYAAGDIPEARALFLRALATEPENPRLLNNLGVIACHDEEIEKAVELFGRAYALGGKKGKTLINLLSVLDASGRTDLAKSLARRHLEEFPSDEAVAAYGFEGPGASVPAERPQAPNAPRRATLSVVWQNRGDMQVAPGGDCTVIEETTRWLADRGHKVAINVEPAANLREYDIVHLNNISRAQDTLDQMRNARSQGKPTVLTALYEDMDRYLVPAMKTDLIFRYLATKKQRIALEDLARLREGFELQEDPLAGEMARRFGIGDADKQRAILEGVDCILTSGRAESESIRRKFGRTAPIEEMHYGFNRGFRDGNPRLFRERFGLEDFALCVGRLEPRKNQWQLIEVFRELPRLKLVLIGRFSDPTMEPLIKAYAPSNVIFLPRLEMEELTSAFAAARLHVLPSWYELPGLVSLEAAAAGCRVATTDWGTSRDYFGDLAHYLPPDDPVRMKKVILEAFESEPRGLREHILGTFSWEATARRAEEAYLKVLGR